MEEGKKVVRAKHGGNKETVFSRYNRKNVHKHQGVVIQFTTPEQAQARKSPASSREVDVNSHNYKRDTGNY